MTLEIPKNVAELCMRSEGGMQESYSSFNKIDSNYGSSQVRRSLSPNTRTADQLMGPENMYD